MVLLVGLVSDEALRELIRAGGSGEVRFAGDPAGLGRLVTEVRPRGLVVEVGRPGLWKSHEVVGALAALDDLPPVLVCWHPSVPAARELVGLSTLVSDLRVVVPGYEDVGLAVKGLVGSVPSGGESVILRGVSPVLVPPSSQVVVGAVVAGRRRVWLSQLARCCGLSVRTMQRWLKGAGLPPPARLLGWCISLHALWWLDLQAWPERKVCQQMGFSSCSALSRYVKRHVGAAPAVLRRKLGFAGLLDGFKDLLCR
ncbi:MAG: hypothetical protein KatS3mg081_0341 [Gemmatimonadales bacterium]|nr:MAG: hypothetical protein KatS3mg081_0341 [Gemmatimonadales bacterium]